MLKISMVYFILALLLAFPASAATYMPQGDLIGEVMHYRIEEKDNLYEIARRFDIGIVELLASNPGIDPWMPSQGLELTLATAHLLPAARHEEIVINLPELRLFFYAANGQVMSFPIGIGREGWRTPLGKTKILRKREHPIWTPPPSIRAEDPSLPAAYAPGPENPLGEYALDLGLYGVLIHGTNRPYGVGKRSSHGCIRLYPEDIATLFAAVEVGTPVTIIDTPFKLGWQGNALFLEVTPTQSEADKIAEYQKPRPFSIPEIYDAIRMAAGESTQINWYAVEEAVANRNGIPAVIGVKRLP